MKVAAVSAQVYECVCVGVFVNVCFKAFFSKYFILYKPLDIL